MPNKPLIDFLLKKRVVSTKQIPLAEEAAGKLKLICPECQTQVAVLALTNQGNLPCPFCSNVMGLPNMDELIKRLKQFMAEAAKNNNKLNTATFAANNFGGPTAPAQEPVKSRTPPPSQFVAPTPQETKAPVPEKKSPMAAKPAPSPMAGPRLKTPAKGLANLKSRTPEKGRVSVRKKQVSNTGANETGRDSKGGKKGAGMTAIVVVVGILLLGSGVLLFNMAGSDEAPKKRRRSSNVASTDNVEKIKTDQSNDTSNTPEKTPEVIKTNTATTTPKIEAKPEPTPAPPSNKFDFKAFSQRIHPSEIKQNADGTVRVFYSLAKDEYAKWGKDLSRNSNRVSTDDGMKLLKGQLGESALTPMLTDWIDVSKPVSLKFKFKIIDTDHKDDAFNIKLSHKLRIWLCRQTKSGSRYGISGGRTLGGAKRLTPNAWHNGSIQIIEGKASVTLGKKEFKTKNDFRNYTHFSINFEGMADIIKDIEVIFTPK